jgi:hypothetical protein
MVNTTFIIPIKIDSDIRYNNIHNCIKFLLENTNGNIIITESDNDQKLKIQSSARLEYYFIKNNTNYFYRTKLLNQMLNCVLTPITVNYDADVFLLPETYKLAEREILENKVDLYYPFGLQKMHQIRLYPERDDVIEFKKDFNFSKLKVNQSDYHWTMYGHCQFFNTESYRKGFMENENYVDWGPEDAERAIRFQKLGYNVKWGNNLVFHQEHPPSIRKKLYEHNVLYHEKLINMTKEELLNYYNNEEYWKKYK